MASIKAYKLKTGKTRYRVDYTRPDGTNTTKRGFVKAGEAKQWAADNVVKIANGTWVNPVEQRRPVNDFSPAWLAHVNTLSPSSARSIKSAWRNHVEPHWGTTPVGSIRKSDVSLWLASLPQGAAQVRRIHSALAQVLDIAVDDGVLISNPARGIKLPKKPPPKHIYLTTEQLALFASECTKHKSMVWVMGTVGLRWGEAAGLKVKHVNVLRQRLLLEDNAVTVAGTVVVGPLKGHEKRSVAVSKPVMCMLEKQIEGKGPEALVWSSPSGDYLRLPDTGSWFVEAAKRVRNVKKIPDGVSAEDQKRLERENELRAVFPAITAHSLRHVAAGLLVSAGANVKVVQRQLGHKSAAYTLDIYADLFDDDLDEVARAMDGLLNFSVTAPSRGA